jgi:hypothetical protein
MTTAQIRYPALCARIRQQCLFKPSIVGLSSACHWLYWDASIVQRSLHCGSMCKYNVQLRLSALGNLLADMWHRIQVTSTVLCGRKWSASFGSRMCDGIQTDTCRWLPGCRVHKCQLQLRNTTVGRLQRFVRQWLSNTICVLHWQQQRSCGRLNVSLLKRGTIDAASLRHACMHHPQLCNYTMGQLQRVMREWRAQSSRVLHCEWWAASLGRSVPWRQQP